ncbi:hypothetical protein PQR14_23370 [Paraburkholderia bryophila]|uniref:hypothetical protein n=1 Tax=Burkholderiaceae TaxID=119060 RepID=UPI000550CD7A|nr:hypothetical protein [Burkholderia sp. 9120]
MELWIQPRAACADLHGQPSLVDPHGELLLDNVDWKEGQRAAEKYTCARCSGVMDRALMGKPARQLWTLMNAGQH